MGMDMPAHAEPQHPVRDHHAMWEKCGYCTLLFSCPALPGTVDLALFGALNPKLSGRPTPGWATPGNRSSPAPDPARLPHSFKHRHNNFTWPTCMRCFRQPQARGRVVFD
jgi:hypothetical protein